MKTIRPVLCLFFLCYVFNLMAQDPNEYRIEVPVPKIHQENALDYLPRLSPNYKYKLDSAVYSNVQDTGLEFSSKYYFLYNSKGWLMEEGRIFWNSVLVQRDSLNKVQYTRDSEGRVTLEEFFNFFPGSSATPKAKNTYSYTSQGWLEQRVEMTYDWQSASFVPVEKERMAYNADGFELKYTLQYFDTNTLVWQNNSETETEFNSSQNITNQVVKTWVKSQSKWDTLSTKEYVYNANQEMVQYVQYAGTQPSNFFDDRFSFSYDGSGNLIETYYEGWDTSSNQWAFKNKQIVSYNSWNKEDTIWVFDKDTLNQDRLIFLEYFAYDHGGYLASNYSETTYSPFGMEDSVRFSFSNDVNGNVVETARYRWSINNSSWDTSWYSVFEYDGLGNRTLEESYTINSTNVMKGEYKREWVRNLWGDAEISREYNWNSNAMAWKLNSEEDVRFSEHIPAVDLLHGLSLEYKSRLDQLMVSEREVTTDQMEVLYQVDYYWSPTSLVSLGDEVKNEVKIFPNPAKDHLNIELDENRKAVFQLFDAHGKRVFSITISGTSSVSIQELPAGLYMYSMEADVHISFGKLVVQ